MNVLLISECDKRALTETRRILDQFAERRGERTWQTPITQNGLETLRRLLRQTARKNTAVACHWIRGLDHSELLWVVGDKSRFNARGAVPTNTTRRNVLRSQDENDWHSGEDIHLLSALAALLHDLGKSCAAFQKRLMASDTKQRNLYRHEWVSLRLFQAFVGTDDDATWLGRLANPTPTDVSTWTDVSAGRLQRDGLDPAALCARPFQALSHAPLAQAVGWLIVTHHRLPVLPDKNDQGQQNWLGKPYSRFDVTSLQDTLLKMQANWNEITGPAATADVASYWEFPSGLPVTLPHWQAQARRLALRLQTLLTRPDRVTGFVWLNEPYIMHLSRLSLMLADHHYSSLSVEHGRKAAGRLDVPLGCTLWANTRFDTSGHRVYNQPLDEHLLGVAQGTQRITHALPSLTHSLPGLVHHKKLRQRTQNQDFAWQNKAADLAANWREQASECGAFVVNMASTGCGKTLANARLMNALADPVHGLRCAFAMGLRTLTLQTGRAFQELLALDDEQLAIRVGGSASRALFEHFEQRAEAAGSASCQALLLEDEEEGSIEFAGDAGLDKRHPVLARTLHDPNVKKLLAAPLLVCTIDHLTPATESWRGGRQIAPMLRLLTSDLVLDEPDDFDVADLPALTRLVHWAGLLGSRVLLSSATLAPALVQGLFQAYRAGRMAYQRHRGSKLSEVPTSPAIACLWVDEFYQMADACSAPEAFEQKHQQFVTRRCASLATLAAQEPRRRCALVNTESLKSIGQNGAKLHEAFALLLRDHALKLHQLHANPDPQQPNRRISFGLMRMANIEPLVQVALALFRLGAPPGTHIHLCVYHSQFPLLLRSSIERRLDTALNRRQSDAVFALPDIRHRLETHSNATDHLFIVLGSPVTEVGRDHDYDWAIVEPSSMRSLIQLVGRVRRHRSGACTAPNVRVLESNLRYCARGNTDDSKSLVYYRPGFEAITAKLEQHLLRQVLRREEFGVVDARPRIVEASTPNPSRYWVDLEHFRIRRAMLPPSATDNGNPVPPDEAAWWWWHQPPDAALMTAILPQHQPFRHDSQKRVDVCLRPSDDNPDDIQLTEVLDSHKTGKRYVPMQKLLKPWLDTAVNGPGITPWADADYAEALAHLAHSMDLPLQACAERFGTASLPESDQGWCWHPVLGFLKHP